jgi:hypothetical protein
MHINPEIADAFGLRILIIGAVVLVAGIVVGRTATKR